MESGNIYRLSIGILMLLSGMTFFIMIPGEPLIGSLLFVCGLVFSLTSIIRQRKYQDGPETDERSCRIGAYGLSYAWLTGIFFMFILFLADYSGVLKLSTQVALGLSIIILALSAVVFQTYLFRKGEVG